MIGIDLTEPIRAQWARAQERLKQLQADHAEEWNFVDRLNTRGIGPAAQNLVAPLYWVLDARDEGVSYQEIGVKLKRLGELTPEIEGMGLKRADAALDRIERAKSDAKKSHKAALRVANNDDA